MGRAFPARLNAVGGWAGSRAGLPAMLQLLAGDTRSHHGFRDTAILKIFSGKQEPPMMEAFVSLLSLPILSLWLRYTILKYQLHSIFLERNQRERIFMADQQYWWFFKGFDVRNNKVWSRAFNDCNLDDLAKSNPTPLYLTNGKRIED